MTTQQTPQTEEYKPTKNKKFFEVSSEEMKQTELGELPKSWEVKKIQEVVEFERGTEPGSKNYNDKGKGIRFLRVSDISGNRKEFIYTISNKIKLCSPENVLITFDGSPGIVKKGFKGAYSSGIRKVNLLNESTDLNFIFYVLQTSFVQDVILKHATGVTIKHASKSIPHIKIPLPPLPEQQKIAYVLSTVQTAQEKTENFINSLKELKKSAMKHLFTYGAVSFEDADKVELKETEIGMIPKSWEVVRLGDIFDIQQGKQLSANEDRTGKIKIPFLRTSNLLWGRVDLSKIDYMFFSEKEVVKLQLLNNDVLVCEGGDVGRTALWKGELKGCLYQNHIYRLRTKKNYDSLLFVLWMEYAIKTKGTYVADANRTTIPNLSASRLKKFLVPTPELPEQQRIASILSAIDEKIQAEENKKKALEELFKSMLHNLMTAKIRVNELVIPNEKN